MKDAPLDASAAASDGSSATLAPTSATSFSNSAAFSLLGNNVSSGACEFMSRTLTTGPPVFGDVPSVTMPAWREEDGEASAAAV